MPSPTSASDIDKSARICTATANGLAPAQDWIARAHQIWNARLDRLEDYLGTLSDLEDPKS